MRSSAKSSANIAHVLNNPSGGLRYHLRALRRRTREWQPYRTGLSTWLSTWQPGRRTLAIVGPSAGHCLPLEVLTQFERFVIFEIDPLARYILKRRMQAVLPERPIVWVTEDVWLQPVNEGGGIPRALLSDSALLFSNVIGQVSLMLEPGQYLGFRKEWQASLFPFLEHTPWASFHDRVSGDLPPYAPLPTHDKRLSDAEISALYEGDPSRDLIELNDHRSQELLPQGYSYRYLHWPLTRTMHHLIECVLGGPRA
jgi:hypothetical protein